MQADQQQTKDTTGVLDQFQTQLTGVWARLPNKGFFFSLLGGWFLLFHFLGNSTFGYANTPSLFGWLLNAYNSGADTGEGTIGKLIPFLILALLWWKRESLLAAPLRTWGPALMIVGAGMVLHIVAYVIQMPVLSVVALFLGVYGLMGLAWGPVWLKRSLFPFCLFVFSIPLGSQAAFLTVRLALLVSWLVEVVCHLVLGIDIIRHGNLLFDPTGAYQYEVAAACSGIRSLTVVFLLSTVYGFVVFRSPCRRLIMVSLGLPLAILGNLTRMLCIIIAAAIGGQPWGDYMHEGGPMGILSLVPYVPAVLGVLWVGRLLERKENRSSVE